MNLKKFISGVSALAIAASAFAAMTITASAEDATTVLNETFTSGAALTNGTGYTWASEFTDTETVSSMLKTSGLLLTNGNNKSNNYTDKSLVTFTSAVGDESNSVNISYEVGPQDTKNTSKGQNYNNYVMSYYDNAGRLAFSIMESVGKWANNSTLTYATEVDSETSTVTTATASLSTHINSSVNAKVTYNANGGIITIDGNSYSFVASSGIKDVKLTVSGNQQDYNRGVYIKNYIITTEAVTEQTAVVTINSYDRADDSLIATTSTTAAVNSTYTATEDDTATFTAANGKKYVYNSSASASTASADVTSSGAAISLYFDEAAKYQVSAVASTDNSVVFGSDEVYDGNTFSYAYPKYLTNETNAKVVATSDSATYKASQTVSEANEYEVAYTAYTGTAQAVEFENVSTGAKGSDGNPSNGQYARANGTGTELFTVAETGVYTITIAGCSANTNKKDETVFAIYKNSVEESNSVMSGNFVSSFNYIHSTNTLSQPSITLSKGDKLILTGNASYTNVDYVLITKTADVTFNAENKGAFEGDSDSSTATAFLADIGNVTGTVSVTITPSSEEIGTAKTIESDTTLTDANITLGLIVTGLYDAAATAVVILK